MRLRLGLGLALAAAFALSFGIYARGGEGAEEAQQAFDAAHSDMTYEDTASFQAFALYAMGESFEGLGLTSITRRDDPSSAFEPVRADYVGFIYGDCAIAEGEEACAPPLEVQVWPACIRNLSTYQLTPTPGSELPHEDVVVRGAPGAVFEDGYRLELYTGEETVVIFGDEEAQLFRAAEELASVNGGGIGPGDPLPVPAAQALEGGLACDA
ncbi:MAG: hypothetical protein ACRDMY_13605 [Gaiellaceae bacterium]